MKPAIVIASLLLPLAASAAVKLPAYITSNMVMQHDATLTVKGSATPDSQVTASPSWLSKDISAKAGKDGRFTLSIPTPAPGGPFSVVFSDGEETVIDNLLSGELWLCSGQSNMEFPIQGWTSVMDADHVVATAHNPDIRLLQVRKKTAFTPQEDVETNMGGWVEAASNTMDFSAIAYLFAKELRDSLKVPVGVIDATWGGTPAEAWTGYEALKSVPGFETELATLANGKTPQIAEGSSSYPTVLYNAMLYPLQNLPIQGVLWYQGCANVGRADQYEPLFQALIKDWRGLWGRDFPFYFVQLAGWLQPKTVQPDSDWAALRNAQSKALALPNTAMVSAIDLGHPGDIHPRDKQTVAHRLALTALNRDYGHAEADYKAPLCTGMKREGDKIRLTFDSDVQPTSVAAIGFIIGDKEGNFVQAMTEMPDSRTVVVWSPRLKNPDRVRYNWADYPNGNLYSPSGIPLAPFATDK